VTASIETDRAAPAAPEGAPAGATGTTGEDSGAAPTPTADTTRVLVVGDSYTTG
jgi:hypothetical protein